VKKSLAVLLLTSALVGSVFAPVSSAKPMSLRAKVTAICWDGTQSFSQHRRGTCSWHGGVKIWVNRPYS
jgi:hypothetical protein